MGVLTTVVIISQHIANHDVVHFKYTQFLLVNYTSVKLLHRIIRHLKWLLDRVEIFLFLGYFKNKLLFSVKIRAWDRAGDFS